jgi:RNA recognition motif-containing protein
VCIGAIGASIFIKTSKVSNVWYNDHTFNWICVCVLPPDLCDLAAFYYRHTPRRSIKEIEKMEAKLYVGNLSYTTSEDELRTLFTQAGQVVSVAVIKDRDTGTSKGFGFVEMTTQVDAQKAISMFNEYKMGDRSLLVNLAKPRVERSSSRTNRF